MCGRFHVNISIENEIRALLGANAPGALLPVSGDIRPSERALILLDENHEIMAETMVWGFPQYTGKGLLINARAETAAEKTMFRNSLLQRRCAIPASWFYEWNPRKEKVTFKREDHAAMYMAGIYQRYEDGNHFVILTTDANASMRPVHDRMPVILGKEELEAWMEDEGYMRYVLKRVPVELWREQEYEQRSLFD